MPMVHPPIKNSLKAVSFFVWILKTNGILLLAAAGAGAAVSVIVWDMIVALIVDVMSYYELRVPVQYIERERWRRQNVRRMLF